MFRRNKTTEPAQVLPRFYDAYPQFYSTSQTGPNTEWNNRRHIVLIEGCLDLIAGKRIVDFGSHDGRWAFAALKAGASHVTCVEPGKILAASTFDNFRAYGIDNTSFEVCQTGAVEYVEQATAGAETAFLFGMLTLISEQPTFFGHLRRLGIKDLIIDTHIMPGETRPLLELFRAGVQDGNAIVSEKTEAEGWMMGATPSLPALDMMLRHYGWEPQLLDWSTLQQHPDMTDYSIGRRVSIRASLAQ